MVNKQELRSERAALPTEQQIFVAGEGLTRVGEIVGLRAEIHLQEINYLLHPVMALDEFDRLWRKRSYRHLKFP